MKTIYECELCGQRFENFGECLDHEDKHVVPLYSSGARPVGYRNNDPDNSRYPSFLHVKMTNDAVVSYRFSEIVARGDEECGESEEAVADVG